MLDIDKSNALARAAIEHQPKTADEAFDIVLEGVRDIPRQLQMLIDSIAGLQEKFPMSQTGWERFVKDIEYTNRKYGYNLQIPPIK